MYLSAALAASHRSRRGRHVYGSSNVLRRTLEPCPLGLHFFPFLSFLSFFSSFLSSFLSLPFFSSLASFSGFSPFSFSFSALLLPSATAARRAVFFFLSFELSTASEISSALEHWSWWKSCQHLMKQASEQEGAPQRQASVGIPGAVHFGLVQTGSGSLATSTSAAALHAASICACSWPSG